jgi:hypothetical protein
MKERLPHITTNGIKNTNKKKKDISEIKKV